jgi:hypothetical protein
MSKIKEWLDSAELLSRALLGIYIIVGTFSIFVYCSVIMITVVVPRVSREVCHLAVKVEKATSMPRTISKAVVDYEIEYGTIYTGDQTPIIHKSTLTISENNGNGTGENGLPIMGFGPDHSDITFKLYNGEEATLHIPVLALKQAGGLLEIKNSNGTYMTVEVSKKENGTFFVRAFPAANQGNI